MLIKEYTAERMPGQSLEYAWKAIVRTKLTLCSTSLCAKDLAMVALQKGGKES